ncbi:hypothetical protein PAXINDRAFT_176502 [Paxillus involutus ATCC 200175]|uniref:Peptide hydrolase n=1 Tax=Paxillus involutus ATCC 200175 TaxID=664439 RepID=A0A0C9TJ14_PAXIN|nr:hypothetical protein PAXINDRAFT_176502 [Paxillus involutus ATCC 200175]
MSIRNRVATVLGFNAIPTTILLVLIYAAIFSTVLVTDNLPSVPKDTRGLDLDQAWLDLHQVSARPHPFNSHANDLVRDYIRDRLGDVASQYPHVTIHDDFVSNASWASALLSAKPYAVYYEGNNILVKVEGTDPDFRDSGGFLLSAHFDSVSTAPGTTDDSMGVVTLMQMVEYFAKNRAKRTVIFNINNGEEDGLNGAHAFMEHPWANISDVFLNLEGAAAGGRPAMFRVTTTAPLYSWTGDHVPHPHANVISAEAFSRGVIRSGTDYSVYEQGGLHGLDFAFYRGRSRYHTKYDSIPGMVGGKKALWAMMEGTHGASLALANDDAMHAEPGKQDQPVYFDLFGAALVIFSLETLFVTNVVLLTAGPIVFLLLAYSEHIVRFSKRIRHRHHSHANANGSQRNETSREGALAVLKKIGTSLWGPAKFWAALVVSACLQAALIAGYVDLNPFVIHTYPFLVLTSATTLAYLTTVLVLTFPLNKYGIVPAPEQQKLSILSQTYIFTWILLVFSTVLVRKIAIGGTYFITAWNAVVLLGSIVAYVEGMTSARGFEPEHDTEPEGQRYARGIRYEAVRTDEPTNGRQTPGRIVEDPEPTEITPLVRRERPLPPRPAGEEQGAIGWWILQLLLVVPLPVILIFHIAIQLLGAMNQTLTDGNDPTSLYTLVSILALFIVLPLAPFSINAHRLLTSIVLFVFVLSTVFTWVAFPFSQETPLKVYFAQAVDLSASGTGIERVVTALTGPKQFLASHILTELPSAFGKPVDCYDATDKVGLRTCTWEVSDALAPSPGGRKFVSSGIEKPWVSSSFLRTGSNTARITVRGLNTRSCTLQFANQRISKFRVIEDGEKGLQKGYEVPEKGLEQIRLWSRNFGKEFEVEVEWKDGDASEQDVEGRISCGWAEYESATVGGGKSGGKIPSLEEIIQFLPEWAVVSKSRSGLFEARRSFSI